MNESLRLEALRKYEILDTPPDGAFDGIAAITAALFRVPIAIISLVDHDRIWFKSHHGLDACETGREPGLCASAILSPDLYQVCDAAVDSRTLANPLVAGEMGLRFYAAAPLRTNDGFNLGTLCVIDRAPRELTSAEATMLPKLAAMVMDQMHLRLAARRLDELNHVQQEMADELRIANGALEVSKARFHDLFDEAPISYVYEDLDARWIHANRAAQRMLGIKPEEVAGLDGKSLLANTAENEFRVKEAFAAIGRGTDTRGVVLELRRKDNGQPVWVEYWSTPALDGTHSRTMLVDVTERVLLEQERIRLQAQNAYLSDEIRISYGSGSIVCESEGLRRVLQQVSLVGPTNASVLISGESGTGKELIALAIHEHSSRVSRPLIKVNCSAFPENLFESEFFGYVRGAFTGAIKDKPGRFELADGGTLFLDEIGEVPLAMQAKLLRVLQEHEMERIGDTRTRKVDVRIVAATNRDLKKEVDAGRFRQDLFYRLSVFPILLPPLRDRPEDIPALAVHFARKSAQQMNRPTPTITHATMNQLVAYDWPGNVRELQNAVERAVIISRGDPLRFELAESTPSTDDGGLTALSPAAVVTRKELKSLERENIVHALKQADGRLFGSGGAAELLGMKPTTLASRIKALRIPYRAKEGTRE
ncbi:MAG: sigma 54-interacting transcriptional regulator [Vicinamibacteria bacterium]